jgi:hypothetical protein
VKQHQIGNAAPRELVLAAYELREEGYSNAVIGRTLGVDRRVVGHWFNEPEKFDPYFDEVALERALAGERKVFDALTIYEADEFYRRVEERFEREPYDNKIHYPEYEGTGAAGTRKTYWMHDLERSLGMSSGWLRQAIRNRRKARAAVA